MRRDECMDKSFVVSGLRNFIICRILYMAIECFTANLAIMDWHWHRSVKSGAARIGNTWIVESPTAMESTEILTIDNCSYQSLRCCLINGCEWTNLGNRKYRLLQPLEHDRETKCRLVEKKIGLGVIGISMDMGIIITSISNQLIPSLKRTHTTLRLHWTSFLCIFQKTAKSRTEIRRQREAEVVNTVIYLPFSLLLNTYM